MINLFKKLMQLINEKHTRYEVFIANAENEYQAMSCGAGSSRFLAEIKMSKAENNKNKCEENKN